MKLAKYCWLPVLWATLSIEALAQYPDIVPTPPTLPPIMDTTLPPSRFQPRDDEPPPYARDLERPVQPERSYKPYEGQTSVPLPPTAPIAAPPLLPPPRLLPPHPWRRRW